MPSKYCPKCGKIVSANYIPYYCAWGCGSLKDQPLIPSGTNLLDFLKQKQEEKLQSPKQLSLF